MKLIRSHFSQKAFTIPEVVIALGVFSILFGFISFNLLSAQRQTSLNAVTSTLLSDIKQQQLKSMMGDINGGEEPTTYGIHFEEDQYTLFSGSSYDASNSSNFVVALPENVIFSQISLPESLLVFSRIDGKIENYSATANSFTVSSTRGSEQKTFYINPYGGIEDN